MVVCSRYYFHPPCISCVAEKLHVERSFCFFLRVWRRLSLVSNQGDETTMLLVGRCILVMRDFADPGCTCLSRRTGVVEKVSKPKI